MKKANTFIKIIKNLEPEEIQAILNSAIDAFANMYSRDFNENNKFLGIFKAFNFSLNEFEQSENAITPEILSILYEMAYSKRKNHGVYYTPKQIVQYMCRESIYNYLDTFFAINTSPASTSPLTHFLKEEGNLQAFENINLPVEQALAIDNALSNIKVCDPAIGCGAFAVGILHEISMLRNLLTPYINYDRTLYELKKHAVENSIYGADIDKGAVEITKKRLWLSLLNENSSAESLNNIKFNILNGNSLTGEIDFLKNPNFFDIVLANPPYVGEKGNKEIFEEVKRGPLGIFHQGKMDLFYFFFHLALNIAKENGEIAFITTNYFPTASGGQKLRKDLKERAIFTKIINFNNLKLFNSALGQHNMITFLQKSQNHNLKVKIMSCRKKGYIENEIIQDILESKDKETDYAEIEQKNLYDGEENYIRLYNSDTDKMLENILNKMNQNSQVLGEICYIHQGLKTNADKVTQKHLDLYPDLLQNNIRKGDDIFIIQKGFKDKNFSTQEKRFLKPFFKNCEIKKYFVKANEKEYVLFITKENYLTSNDVNIKQHLDKFKSILQNRAEIVPDGRIPLYAITRPRKDFMFNGPKIVAPYKSKSNTFAYSEGQWYASGDVYYINQKSVSFELKYILALLNSKIYGLWFAYKGKRKGNLIELYQKPLSEVPIYIADALIQAKLAVLVEKMFLAGEFKTEIQEEIDQLIYKLFGLSESEVEYVENLSAIK